MFLLFYSKTFSALLIVSVWTAWSFVCAKCQLNQSLEQQIIENPNRAVSNEYNRDPSTRDPSTRDPSTRDLPRDLPFPSSLPAGVLKSIFRGKWENKNKNNEYNEYNMYNESFKSSESNVYDQYDEYNQYEQYRHRYAEFPW